MFALWLALETASPSPSPASTAPPEIVRVVVSPICATLRETVLPVSRAARENDALIEHAIANAVVTEKRLRYSDRISRDAYLSALSFQTESDVGKVFARLEDAEHTLRASRKRYPDAKYPEIAAVRKQLEQILEFQRRANFVLDSGAGSYLDNQGFPTTDAGAFSSAQHNAAPTGTFSEKGDIATANAVNAVLSLLGLPEINPDATAPNDATSLQAQRVQVDQNNLGLVSQKRFGPALGEQQLEDAITNSESTFLGTAENVARTCV